MESIRRWKLRASGRGQYMVEFGLTFIFFIGITLAVINLMLLAYNFNLTQRVAWEAARKASVGKPNHEIAYMIYNDLITKYFASPFLMSAIAFDSTTFIQPNEMKDRLSGTVVTISLPYRAGFSFLEGSNIYATFPIQTSLIVIAPNDVDRDGWYDTTISTTIPLNERDSFVGDHDNDGNDDATFDTDVDADAYDDDISDWANVRYNSVSQLYEINMPGDGAGWRAEAVLNKPPPNNGMFFARTLYSRDSGTAVPGPYPLVPQKIPRNINAPADEILTIIDLRYDSDNDGWDDWIDP